MFGIVYNGGHDRTQARRMRACELEPCLASVQCLGSGAPNDGGRHYSRHRAPSCRADWWLIVRESHDRRRRDSLRR
jgi:hypothetical protein